MRTHFLHLLAFVASVYFLLVPQLQMSAGVDQLVIPVKEDELPGYQAELQAKLLVTPADIARMIVCPASQPEFALSVYSRSPASADDLTKYKVTVTRASANIWSAGEPVQTNRLDAELPGSVALLVKEVWKQKLLAARSYDSPVHSPVDGAIVEFALLEPNQSTLRGELPINPASDILSLENLGTLLVNYCLATTDEQSVLAKEIGKTAKSLLKREPDVNVVAPKGSSSGNDPDVRDPAKAHLKQRLNVSTLGPTQALAVVSNATTQPPDRNPSWGTAILGTRVVPANRPQLDVWFISEESGKLVGSCMLANIRSGSYEPVELIIAGEWRGGGGLRSYRK